VLASCLLTVHASADIIVLFIVLDKYRTSFIGRKSTGTACLWTKNFASHSRPFKVIRNHTEGVSKFLLNTCLCYTVNAIFSVRYWRDLEILVRGRSLSIKMAPIDKSHTTYFFTESGSNSYSTYIHTYITICIARCVDSTEYMSNQRRWYFIYYICYRSVSYEAVLRILQFVGVRFFAAPCTPCLKHCTSFVFVIT